MTMTRISLADEASSSAVDAQDAGAPLALDRIGGEPVAVVDIDDVDLCPGAARRRP